ncbi:MULTISPECIES: TRAP transporter large permease [unclassified Chelatococcus]|uniref:TRAP transporter large permease n=1 Tax=unclassified Chelatococcus TaxID=2638111 RepID=UPI001BCC4A78|nr:MULTISPECIES: TRAP transporter large permease [unclassified Chelatococcus]MBS7700348.1 TRAP transporter large permease [Chelatococcus sp. YT9]MBX3556144.1 TRAP transporter large permease [Chelatococcus sp.]
MSAISIGLIGMAALVAMILARIPVAVALGLVGFVGYAAIDGFAKAQLVFGAVPLELSSAYALSVLPLFTLMGALATMAGLSGDLFRASNAVFAGMRGSLAMAAVGASAGFGAVCGSSLATAATMSRISIPQMLKAGYSPALAAGAVAAGGTLGILIPPSLILMIYGIIAQLSIIKLFAAALIPGLVLTVLYLATVTIWVWLRPWAAPRVPTEGRTASFRLVLSIWDVILLFAVTFGGIYLGWFSPTEAAAVGAFGALLLGLLRRGFKPGDIGTAFTETTRITANLVLIVLGSTIFSYFVVQTGMAQSVVRSIDAIGLPPLAVMLLLVVFYVFLGCFLEGIGMVLVTVPVLLPLVLSTGYDPIWFGVLLVIVVEIGLIHPPVGMNLFVIRTQAPEVSLGAMYRGVLPFLLAPFVLIAMLLAWPDLALWLPRHLAGM